MHIILKDQGPPAKRVSSPDTN